MDTLTQLGIGGLLVVLVLREVFGFLRARRNGQRCLTTAEHDWLKKTHERSERLDRLHAPTDDDGIPLWYLPRSWGKTQVEILKVQRQILDNQRRIAEALARIESRPKKASGG